MIKKLILGLVVVFPLTGCFVTQKSAIIQSKQFFDQSEQARIRLFGSYGDSTIKHYPTKTCEDWRSTMANKVHHRVNNGLPRRIKNISLGMPVTARSLAASEDTGVMTRDSYKEYAVDAGQPLTLDASQSVRLDNFSSSCRVAVNFTPEAGKDYEAYFIIQDRTCTVKVSEITKDTDNKKVFNTEPLTKTRGCSTVGDRTF